MTADISGLFRFAHQWARDTAQYGGTYQSRFATGIRTAWGSEYQRFRFRLVTASSAAYLRKRDAENAAALAASKAAKDAYAAEFSRWLAGLSDAKLEQERNRLFFGQHNSPYGSTEAYRDSREFVMADAALIARRARRTRRAA
jgi:TorA maturation chaperone TorD